MFALCLRLSTSMPWTGVDFPDSAKRARVGYLVLVDQSYSAVLSAAAWDGGWVVLILRV